MSATTTTNQTLLHLLQHPSHKHPLTLRDFSHESWSPNCCLCYQKIWAEAYTCQEACQSCGYYHTVCVEAPPQIDRHPLHPDHPLPLVHFRPFNCHACGERFSLICSSFSCDKCEFNLDICCALSTLSDEGSPQVGNTSELVTLPIHPDTLTSFSTRHVFVGNSNCYICLGSVEGDGFMCLRRSCRFIIHKRCIQDLYFRDGTKAPRVYHGHPLEVFVELNTGSSICAGCGSKESGEVIGCATCGVSYHRHCFQVPEILRYPPHNADHNLVLFSKMGTLQKCQSCSSFLEGEIYYHCISCEFFVHVGCAFQVLAYCEDGMSAKIELSWHKHPLLLCHRVKYLHDVCSCCQHKIDGPAYVCREQNFELILHKQCTVLTPKIDHHPHHPEHPLALLVEKSKYINQCAACCSRIDGFSFYCELCDCYMHVSCMSRLPTRKHYLHEHDLVQFDKISSMECNRCHTADDSPIFRCIPCNFNLHEKCMELPPVVRHKIHSHPLTLREFFREDDSGEYYCDLCEERRDGRLGVYVCGDCELKMDRPWAFHIECILPELQKVYEKKDNTIAMERWANEITRREEEVHATERKLDEMKRDLEEVRKKHASMALE